MRKSEKDINTFIEKHLPLLYSRTTEFTKKYYTMEYSDILSILMSAFNEAITKYSKNAGHFYPFAESIMQRRVIDEFRKTVKKSRINADSFDQMNSTDGDKTQPIDNGKTFSTSNEESGNYLTTEIEQLESYLDNFNLSFFDIAQSSPKVKKNVKTAIEIVNTISNDKSLMTKILIDKKFVIVDISKLTNQPKSFIMKTKNYLITLLLIKVHNLVALEKYLF